MNIERAIFADMTASDLAFDPVAFFAGTVSCSGFLIDRSGRVRRSFTIEFVGTAKAGAIDIAETLYFNDGEVQHRAWHIAPDGKTRWKASANDIPGPITITRGDHPGECRWQYGMALPIGTRHVTLAFEDVMVMTAPTQMTSLTFIRKFGVRVAQLNCTYTKTR